jgi:DNA primase
MPQGFVSFAEVKRTVPLEAVLIRYGLFEKMAKKGRNLAGPCPFCQGASTRQFQINPAKNAWYCFGCKAGGNVLDFVAKKEGVGVRAAAESLDSWFELGLAGEVPPVQPAATAEPRVPAEEEPAANPPLTFTLKTLDPIHPNLAGLGLSLSTLTDFGAGYCSKGLLTGRLAIPIRNSTGELVAYVGLAVRSETAPRYLFPSKFHPALEVMNLDRVAESEPEDGTLYLVPEIEGVLRLRDAGFVAALGLFDGSLSFEQEEAIRGALTLYERLVLAGEGFEDRTIARLARYTSVSWAAEPPHEPLAEGSTGEEE